MRLFLACVCLLVASACSSSPELVSTGDVPVDPTPVATEAPTEVPTEVPTAIPTAAPTSIPTPAPTQEPAPTAAPTAEPTVAPTAVPTAAPEPSEPPPTAAPAPTAQPTVAPPPSEVRVPDALPATLAPFALPPGGEPLCVVDIVGPDTLNLRSGPGVEYAIRGALRPDACILRAAGPATNGWQPVHAVVASQELLVLEGWVSSTYVTPASAAGTAEAAVVANDPASILSVNVNSDPLRADPCAAGPDGAQVCELTGWFWQEAPHPCAQHPFSHWKLSTIFTGQARPQADGTWTAASGPSLVLDC